MKKYTKTRMIMDFLKGSKRFFVAALILSLVSSVFEMISPRIIEFTVDGILGDETFALPGFITTAIASAGGMAGIRTKLWIPALALLFAQTVTAVSRGLFFTTTTRGSETFVKTMRDMLFSHIEHLSCQWHSQHQTGDIIQRATSDVEMVKGFLADQLVTFVRLFMTILFSLIFMFRVSTRLATVTLISVPLIVGFSLWFNLTIGKHFKDCDESEGVLSTIVQENLTGVRVVRAFGRERMEQDRFADQNKIVTDKWEKLSVFMCSYWSVSDLITGSMTVTLIALGCRECVSGALTVGGFITAMMYLGRIGRPVRMLGRVLSEMSKMGVSATRIYEIMSTPVEDNEEGLTDAPMDGDIVFDHVTFNYPNCPELLHDVCFTIPAGTTLGILGSTGSGKSTVAQLLAKLYPLNEGGGRITVGGVDVRDMSDHCVRKNVAIVLQEPYLFSRSIADNIAITQKETDGEAVKTVAAAACLDSAVDKFPQGYDTFVGERGVTLSGGQKQRVAIARTLMQNAPILVFDDSLSAVDSETDTAIRENLRKYMHKATVILISHRITTLMEADQILVFDDGRIVEQGTHEELAAKPGLYRTICQIQQGKEAEA